MELNTKQAVLAKALVDMIDYRNLTPLSAMAERGSKAYPTTVAGLDEVLEFFVNKYISFDEKGEPIGYISSREFSPTNTFEETLLFNHICYFLRSKEDKSYIIDNIIQPLFKTLSIPYNFNHFDPRIYDYTNA